MTDSSVPRDSRRVPLETRVQLKFEKFSGFINEFSANISPGGIFIRSERPEPVGTLVDFEFRLGDGFELIKGRGEVAWVRETSDDPAHPAGMGLSFQEISPQGKELIYKVVDRHVQSGGVPFDPTPPLPPRPTPAPPREATPPRPPIAPLVRPAPQEPPIRNADRLLQLFEEATASVEATETSAEPVPVPIAPIPATPAIPATPTTPAPRPTTAEALPPLERTWSGRAPILAPPPEVPMRPVASPLDDTLSRGALIPPEPGGGRRKARRPLRVVVGVVLLALILAGIAAWRVKDIWWDDFFGDPDPEPLPAAFANPERKPMYRSLPGKRALGLGSPTPTVQEAPGAPIPPPATAPPPSSAPLQAATVPVTPPAPSSAGSIAPGSAPAPVSLPSGAASATPAEAPRPVLASLRSISVRALPTETEVVLEGDGIIRSSNFAQFRIDSGTPRELIRFKGIRHAYPATKVAGGTPELVQIRIGYHSPDELHVVLDLTGPEIVVKNIDVSVSRLVIRLGRK